MRTTVAIVALLAALCLGAVAADATMPPTGVTASVSPSRVNAAPYTFTVSGTVTYRKCPMGTTNPDYCVNVPPGQFCKGTVTVSVKLGTDTLLADSGKTILTATGGLSGSCTYSITITIPKAELTATSHFSSSDPRAMENVIFTARFNGNAILSPLSSNPVTAVAKLTEP